jgi:hypothetical protein
MRRKTSNVSGPGISRELLGHMDAYWRAANYLSVGQIYLRDNPLLKKPLKLEHLKKRLLGHRGTTPGLNFIYVHLNRLIKQHDFNMMRRGFRETQFLERILVRRDGAYCATSSCASRCTNEDSTAGSASDTASQSMLGPLARATLNPRTVRNADAGTADVSGRTKTSIVCLR